MEFVCLFVCWEGSDHVAMEVHVLRHLLEWIEELYETHQ
jgi:hypothetical protein